jgi:hypothetical protein
LLRRFPKASLTFLGALAAVSLTSNYFRLQKALQPSSLYSEAVGEAVAEIERGLEAHPELCYAGAVDPGLARLAPDKLLYYHSCLRKAGISAYVVRDSNGYWLAKVSENEPPAALAVPLSGAETVATQVQRRLSPASYSALGARIRFPPYYRGAWVLGYQSDRDFFLVTLDQGIVDIQRVLGGVKESLVRPESTPLLVPLGKPVELSIRRVGAETVLFSAERALQSVPGLELTQGSLGYTLLGQSSASPRLWADSAPHELHSLALEALSFPKAAMSVLR